MNERWIKLLLLASLGLAAACGSRAEATKEGTAADKDKAATKATVTGRQLRLNADLQGRWGIGTTTVTRVSVAGGVSLPGVVGVNQGRTAHVSALLDGTVVSLRADLGQQVKKGQVLLVVHSPAFAQAKSAFLEANARLNLARRESERGRALLKGQAIQEKEVLRREAEYESATTTYGIAESNLHSLGLAQTQIDDLVKRYTANKDDHRLDDLAEPYLDVVAPVDGRVIFKDVIAGEHVHPDKILFTVSDLGTLWALLDARETDLPYVRVGDKVAIRSTVYPDKTFEGRVQQVGDVVDEKLRTIKVRVDVPNAGLLLKPNMYIQGGIEASGGSRQVMAVPDEAVQTIDGESVVFVREAGDVFAMRPVQVGERLGAYRAIVRGLEGNETVVAAGAFTLKAELLKGTFGEGE
ncbi:MAG: efflux RND transporter periplasmic adaptor subunit [Bacteroidales bacterium]